MALFDQHLDEINAYLERKAKKDEVSELSLLESTNWPISKDRNLVLGMDTAVELGSPEKGSTSFVLWGNTPPEEKNSSIKIIGPDLPQLKGKNVPFGKIVIIGGKGFNQENLYDRYRIMDKVRYDIHLKGYMMRGVSQYQREWSRVSKEALSDGFSFNILGSALINKFLELDFVHSVQVIFITASSEDISEMSLVSNKLTRIIEAMNKMTDEMSLDCDTCEYTDVCSEVEELRSMRDANIKKGETNNA